MRIKIKTRVKADLDSVIDGFDQELFLKLNPPFPPVRLLRFDGCQKDDRVELELNFLLFKQYWTSVITEDERSDSSFYFIDKGVRLPFFLKYWKHRHVIQKNGQGCAIIDDIEFKTPLFLFDFFMYPALLLQFLYRRPIYKSFFSRQKKEA